MFSFNVLHYESSAQEPPDLTTWSLESYIGPWEYVNTLNSPLSSSLSF